MSDYDTVPLHDFRHEGTLLPNNGYLTIHNRVCPSLVSGSKQEFDRVGKTIIQHAAANQIDTDQKTLAALNHQEPPVFRMAWTVTQTMLNVEHWDAKACADATPNSLRAAHFAHAVIKKAMTEGKLPETHTIENRPELARQWWTTWMTACGPPQRFVEDPQLLEQTLHKPTSSSTSTASRTAAEPSNDWTTVRGSSR